MTIDITIDALELLDPFEPGFHADPAISYDHVQVLSLNLFFFFFSSLASCGRIIIPTSAVWWY